MVKENKNLLSQDDIDNLLKINELISKQDQAERSLVDELKHAILDSGTLKLNEWISLRKKLKEIEDLIPHIDLIIRLKKEEAVRDRGDDTD